MASTILRVKRRLEDNPQDALVLMCKRIKTDAEEISSSLFVFRATVDNEEASYVKNIVPRNDIKLKSKHNVSDVIEKMRKECKYISLENRYEVVNCSRGLKDNEAEDNNEIDLVDLRQKIGEDQDEVQYAYDLYTAAKPDFDISMLDNLVRIENYKTDLVFGSCDNGGMSDSSDAADDEDDSNDENNWRNDYPDTEPSSIDEDDIVRAIAKCDFDEELSSDEGEDKIYDEPSDLFNEDVKRYGSSYAKYKAKVLTENPDLLNSNNFVHFGLEEGPVEEW